MFKISISKGLNSRDYKYATLEKAEAYYNKKHEKEKGNIFIDRGFYFAYYDRYGNTVRVQKMWVKKATIFKK